MVGGDERSGGECAFGLCVGLSVDVFWDVEVGEWVVLVDDFGPVDGVGVECAAVVEEECLCVGECRVHEWSGVVVGCVIVGLRRLD